MKRHAVLLSSQLAHTIRREWRWQHRLALGVGILRLAINRRRRCIRHALYTGIARGHQHVQRGHHAGAVVRQRVRHRSRHAGYGSQMQYIVNISHCMPRKIQLRQITRQQLHAVRQPAQIFNAAGGKIIGHTHTGAAPHQLLHNIRADKTSPPRHQISCHVPAPFDPGKTLQHPIIIYPRGQQRQPALREIDKAPHAAPPFV